MKVDAKAIIEKIKRQKGDRTKVSLYLSKKLFDAFKDRCEQEGVSASVVMEELINAFIESARGRK